ncbi:hypothetical protein EI94DRAFT_1736523 [Lactarius quietus]|nr:hypothetical protein EI94DRAFT_1736523 [Lactarius quietus]
MRNNGDRWMTFHTLGPIRSVYVALHQGTNSVTTQFSSIGDEDRILWRPSAYPFCKISGHHPDSTPHIHNLSAFTTNARAVLLPNTALGPVSLADTPDLPSSSVRAALHVDENRMDVPPLDNDITALFHPTRQTAMECPHVPATVDGATRSIETSARKVPPTTPVASMSTSSASTTRAIPLQNTAEILVHSDAPEIPSSASSGPVLDDNTSTSPSPTSTPDIGATEGSPKAGSPKDTDALAPSSVDCAI